MIAQSILRKFRDQRVMVMGDCFIDEYILGGCNRLSPEAPVPVLSVDYSYTVLGGAANTAANIASLGAKVVLAGLVGDDRDGALFQKKCGEQNIEFIPVVGDRPTIKKTRLLGQKQQLLRIDYEEIQIIQEDIENEIFAAFSRELPECGIIVLSDYAKGFFTRSLCGKIIRACSRAGKKVIIDPRPANSGFYRNCSYITPNWKESLQLAGSSSRSITYDSVEQVAAKIRKQYGTGVLLTLGSKGVYFTDREGKESFYLPTQSREVFDVSGAGDTVVAVFSLGLCCGLSHRDAVRFSNKAAGAVVGRTGTSVVTPEDLWDEIKPGGGLISRKELELLSRSLRDQDKKIVTINGTFDLMHHGHLHILKKAAGKGDVLIVGLNSDASVRHAKGKKRPYINQKHRAEMLLALEFVDYVHIFNEDAPMAFLEKVKPHIHVNGSEYGKNCIEADTVKKNGGKIHIVKKIKGLSTSDLVKKIRS